MSKLSNLTKSQLDKILLDTQSELSRRESVAKAEKEIRAILKKYSITIDHVTALRFSGESSRKSKAGTQKQTEGNKVKDKRAAVAAKFKSLDGSNTWTGRGRAPKWVTSQCESEGISVDSFKQDERFLIG
jgi:DNA-binding protein H-NS